MRRFKKALIERALDGELTHHLGYPPGTAPPADTAYNVWHQAEDRAHRRRRGRDRRAAGPRRSFERVLILKHERRFTGFDDKILALYARGLTVRESSVSHRDVRG
jgi:putative transposase